MSNQYYKDIVSLETVTSSSGNEGAVKTVYWDLVGTHTDGTVARFKTMTELNPETTEGFVAFESLTANTVLGWLDTAVAASYLDECEGIVDLIIEDKRTEKTPRAIPWA